MSLESILEHIHNEAGVQREKMIREAQREASTIIQEAKKEAEKLYQEIIEKEKVLGVKEKQKLIVQARLEAKQNLLKTKQELMDSIFEKLKSYLGKTELKKRQIARDREHDVSEDINFYLRTLRQDFEAEIAKILF